jgi:hypothetical protein
MFRQELERSDSPHAPPSTFDVTAESPFFNTYASYEIAMDVLAIATMPAQNATASCRATCGSATCMAVLQKGLQEGLQEGLQKATLSFFCIPDPSMLMATVFPTLLDTHAIALQAESQAEHAEILWDTEPLVLLYTSGYEIHLWRAGKGLSVILKPYDLTSAMLTPQVQFALFENHEAPPQPEVLDCVITSAFSVILDQQLVIYISFTFQIKGADAKQNGYLLY